LLGEARHLVHRFAGGAAQCRRSRDRHGWITVVTVHLRRTSGPLGRRERAEWNHFALRIPNSQGEDIFRCHSIRSIGLQQHAKNAPLAAEVIGVRARKGDCERCIHVSNRKPQRAGLDSVDEHAQLRRVRLTFGADR
jgi:hypothetical protein